jgi:iron complex outermembrane receptor protein
VALPRSMANIEQVEVIKGPASILYGQGEPGGLVNNITKKPLDYNFYTVTQEVGSFDRLYTTADATGPLNQASTLLYRLNLAYENAGSFRDFVDSKRFDVFPTLQWKISPKTQITTQLHYGNGYAYLGDTGIPMINGQHVDIPRSRNFSEPGLNRNNVDEYSVKVSWTHDVNDSWKVSNYFKSVVSQR